MLQSKLMKKSSKTEDLIVHQVKDISEWHQIKTPSTVVGRRSCHSSCLHKNKLYVYGGYDNNSAGIYADMFAFSLNDNSWVQIQQNGDLPGKRHSQSAIVYKNEMYMFGGMDNLMSNTNQLHKFDLILSSWSKVKTAKCPPAIDSHKACLKDNLMIVGMGYSQNQYNSNIHALNLDTKEWKYLFNETNNKKRRYPQARSHGAFNLYQESIYIYGGKDFNKIYNDLWKFDIKTGVFDEIQIKNSIPGRFGHSGVVYEGKLFIFGGTKGVTHERNDLIFIDLQKKQLKQCWIDSQQERIKEKSENIPIVKKSKRDSTKRCAMVQFRQCSQHNKSKQSPCKYRNQLKQVNYYNEFYDSRKQVNTRKKVKKSPLLNQIEGVEQNQSLNLTSTYEMLTNSIMLMTGKTNNKQQKGEVSSEARRIPKARDNYTANLIQSQASRVLIFGGGMHKISFNDIILIDLPIIIAKNLT